MVPPIVLLGMTGSAVGAISRRDAAIVGLLCLIALVYTTPWDNYLVYREVWSYGPDRVVATIGFVPVEEYVFFVLQPILAGLTLLVVQNAMQTRMKPPAVSRSPRSLRWIGAAVWVIASGFGANWLRFESTLYLGLIVAWAAPVLAGQWALRGERFANPAVALGIGLPTLYLWIADRFAINDGIWSISERYTIGLAPFGLPVEEALFFLLTNVLVVQGIVMFQQGKADESAVIGRP